MILSKVMLKTFEISSFFLQSVLAQRKSQKTSWSFCDSWFIVFQVFVGLLFLDIGNLLNMAESYHQTAKDFIDSTLCFFNKKLATEESVGEIIISIRGRQNVFETALCPNWQLTLQSNSKTSSNGRNSKTWNRQKGDYLEIETNSKE